MKNCALFVVFATLITGSLQQGGYRFQCGIRQFNLTGLAKTHSWNAAGDWPWHAVVLVQKSDSEKRVCSGTLISKQHVLTTSSCVTDRDGEQIWAKYISVQLGVHKIDTRDLSPREESAGGYGVFDVESNGAIALLKFLPELEFFSSYVQPACVNQVANVSGRYGTVVGWDPEEVSELAATQLRLLDNGQCEKSSEQFCAGDGNSTSVCTLRNGAIMYFRRGNAWFIGGVSDSSCRNGNVAFTGLHRYLSWIRNVTKLHYLEEVNESCKPIDVTPQLFYYLLSHFPGACGHYVANRIGGGRPANIFEFPWMAIVQYKDGDQLGTLCMGTIINNRYVMTTAQCANGDPFAPYRVRLGEHTIDQEEDCNPNDEDDCAPPVEEFEVECALGHQNFDPQSKVNNIGLIRLAREVQFHDHIKPICLPGTYDLARTQLPQYILSGWGRDGSRKRQNTLLKATVPGVDLDDCQRRYEPFGLTLAEDQFCAGGNRTGNGCYGDYGAPLGYTAGYYGDQRFVQFGIASFGTFGCEVFPTVFTNVSVHIGWIIGNVRP